MLFFLLLQILDTFYSIYFINLISMIADNLVEIRLLKIQSWKCLLKSNLWRNRAENVFRQLISMRLDRHGYQPTTCLNPRNFFFNDAWNVLFRWSLSYHWSFVSYGVFSLCYSLLLVSRTTPLTLKKMVNDFQPIFMFELLR